MKDFPSFPEGRAGHGHARETARQVNADSWTGFSVDGARDERSLRAAAEGGACPIQALPPTDARRHSVSCSAVCGGDEGRPKDARLLPTTRPWRERHGGAHPVRRLVKLRKGVMELYISDTALDCLIVLRDGDCELQDMPARNGLRGPCAISGDNTSETTPGRPQRTRFCRERATGNPISPIDPGNAIVCSRCVRPCEGGQGTLRAIRGPRLRQPGVATAGGDRFMSSTGSAGLRRGPAPRHAQENTRSSSLHASRKRHHHLPPNCGVGVRFKRRELTATVWCA